MAKQKITTAGQTRVWLVENGPGPHRQPVYMGTMAIGDSDWPAGDITLDASWNVASSILRTSGAASLSASS